MEIKELVKIVDNYYPAEIALNNPKLFNHNPFIKLISKCNQANLNKDQWTFFLEELKSNSDIEITEFVLLHEFNPSFIAVFLTENYERPKPINYEPLQLVLKISVIAPVFSLYFDNFASDRNKRLIRSNPVTEKENLIFNRVQENLKHHYNNYSLWDISKSFYILPHLGDISDLNKRKPYLDEYIFGLYLSIHPHNSNTDKLKK